MGYTRKAWNGTYRAATLLPIRGRHAGQAARRGSPVECRPCQVCDAKAPQLLGGIQSVLVALRGRGEGRWQEGITLSRPGGAHRKMPPHF